MKRISLAALAAVAAAWCMSASAAPFSLWVTETPPGGTATWGYSGGVRSYAFDGLGYGAGNYSVGPVIAASGLDDPGAVTSDGANRLYISNRVHGAGLGSISRVAVAADGTPGAPRKVLSKLPTGAYQSALTDEGDLVVSFGDLSPPLLYPGITAPAARAFGTRHAVGLSSAGSLLHAITEGRSVQTYDLASGALVSSFDVSGSIAMHYSVMHDGALYVADGYADKVFRIDLGADGLPTSSRVVASVGGGPLSVMFSPKGNEMFVATHFGGDIVGYAVNRAGKIAATPNLVIDGGTLAAWGGQHVNFGGMAITTAVPEPSISALMLAGAAAMGALARRRRSPG